MPSNVSGMSRPVTRGSDDGSGTGHGSVQSRDHGTAALSDGQDQVARHLRELEESRFVLLEEGPDDVLHVPA